MSLVQMIAELDKRLFAEMSKSDAIDDEYLNQQLELRAKLLRDLLNQESENKQITSAESKELIIRSRQLKEMAELLQQQLSDQLKKMNKGRRSVQAYQIVQHN